MLREERELPEAPSWLVGAFRVVGLTEVQARWRARRLLGRLRDTRSLVGFSSGHRRVLARKLGDYPIASVGILAVFFLIYARMFVACPRDGVLSWKTGTLVDFGAYSLERVRAGQWWRLGTANFLHIGLLHLGFNSMALTQVGPSIESLFGRARLLFFFIVTGIVAFATCWAIGLDAVSAGASGSLMGLIGVAAAWGQRDGTTVGREMRDQMLKWAAYTMVFGYFMHANNIAHAGGFVAGGLIGLAYRPARLARSGPSLVQWVMGIVGGAAIAVCAGICLASTPSPRVIAHRAAAPRQPVDDGATNIDATCERIRVGDPEVLRASPAEPPEQHQATLAAWRRFCAERLVSDDD